MNIYGSFLLLPAAADAGGIIDPNTTPPASDHVAIIPIGIDGLDSTGKVVASITSKNHTDSISCTVWAWDDSLGYWMPVGATVVVYGDQPLVTLVAALRVKTKIFVNLSAKVGTPGTVGLGFLPALDGLFDSLGFRVLDSSIEIRRGRFHGGFGGGLTRA